MTQLAKGNPNEMRKSARHKKNDSCSRYEKDNEKIMILLELSLNHEETLSLVPK